MTEPEATDVSPLELLARKFEQWRREFNVDVTKTFYDKDWSSGMIAFELWEQRFISFLEAEAPSLVPLYAKTIQRRAASPSGYNYYDGWKNSKGNPVGAFLEQASKEARTGRLTSPSAKTRSAESSTNSIPPKGKIFIGHGRSSAWRDLKDFLQDRLKLEWDEFNRESVAGITTIDRLKEMLEQATFAFLVLTAEDEHADGSKHARENVIHEVGLFQGKLGFRRAIILVEDECEEFSNVHGLTQIRFPKGNIFAKSEEIRRVLEREGLLK